MIKITSDELNNLGTFATLDAVYASYPSGGVPGNYVVVGNTKLYWDERKLRWGASESDTNPQSQAIDGDLSVGGNLNVGGNGHFGGDVTIDGVLNVTGINLAEPLPVPKDGQSIFKSMVFKRSDSRPATPRSTEGTYYNPVPSGWSDGIPSGTAPIWMTSRVFTNDGESPQGNWSVPQPMADTYSFDVEFSDSVSRPARPDGSNQHGGSNQVWYDPVLDAAYISSHEMIWMATRARIATSSGPAWGAWAIVRVKGETGDDGMGSESAYVVHPKSYAPTITNRYGDVPVTVGYNWQRTTTGLTVPDGSALWMSMRNYQNNIYEPWGDAVRISGDGAPGEDGADIEFIYKQMDRLPEKNEPKPTNNVSQDDFVPEGWYDEAKGVDEDHKCEWMCTRIKQRGSSIWGEWVGPIAWSVYGDKGMDGASTQFVFKRTEADESKPPRPSVTDGGYTNEQGEYIPKGWTDDPQGTNPYYPKEWVSIRRKGERQTDWSPFSEPSLWATYSENHTVEIKNGTWWIDGKDTGVRAEGENGKGVSLKGVVDYKTESEATAAGGGTSLQGVTGMVVGDCYVVQSNGYLYTYNGGSSWPGNWTELGEFRGEPGEPGTSQFFHIAWAYNIDIDTSTGKALDSNTIYTEYSLIPISTYGYPDWVGLAVTNSNNNPSGQDPAVASAYEWNHVRGKDGSDFERVYIRTKKKSNRPRVEAGTNQTDNYTPLCINGSVCQAEYIEVGDERVYRFSDNPKGPDEVWPYEWVAERKKVDGTWGTFGDANRLASLWATYSAPPEIDIDSEGYWTIDGARVPDGNGGYIKAKGEDGRGIQIKGSFASKADLIANVSNPSVGDCYYVTGGADMGHLFFWDGQSWQDLGEIKGEPGQSQYMHVAWATDVKFVGTSDTVQGVTGFTQRNNAGQNYDWVGFYASSEPTAPDPTKTTTPKLYKWNYIKGMDGDQYEHVYIRTADNTSPGVKTEGYASGYTDSKGHAPGDDEFLPLTTESTAREYTDDPHGTDKDNQFEWECYRRKNAGVWGAWAGPYVVHNWAKDGAGQAYVSTDMDQIIVDCTSAGRVRVAVSETVSASLMWGDESCGLLPQECSITIGGVQKAINIPAGSKSIDIDIDIDVNTQFSTRYLVISLVGVDEEGEEHAATKSIPLISNRDGANGRAGASLRFCGTWKPNTNYVYNDAFRDCVKYGGYYWMVGVYGETYNDQYGPGISQDGWVNIGNMQFVATELLLAENGSINLLSSNVINLFNNNNNLVAKINGDGEGSYCIYYPGTTKKWYEMIPGWQIYYDNDANNTELWRLGKTGVIMRPTLGVWTDIRLAAVTQSDLNSFDGSTVFTRATYRQYIADSGEYNGKIFTSEPSNHDPSSTANILPDGMYTPNEKPRKTASIDKGDGYDGYTLTVYNISGGFIVNPREVERVTATEQG